MNCNEGVSFLTSLVLLQGKLHGRQPMADHTPILKGGE